ncbi:hypothetical protein D3C78_1285190 [compost metagenome]
MLAEQLGRFGLGQRLRVDGGEQRLAVVFVEAGQGGDRRTQPLQACGNAFQGLGVAAQAAGQHGIEGQPTLAPVFTQALGLLAAARAELVVIVGAKRGLAVAHKVEGSHGRDCG